MIRNLRFRRYRSFHVGNSITTNIYLRDSLSCTRTQRYDTRIYSLLAYYPQVFINCINSSYVGNEYEKERTTAIKKRWYRICAQNYSRYVHISLISQRGIRCVAFFRRKWRRNFTAEKVAILAYIYIYIYIYTHKIAGCFKLLVRRRRELIEKQQDQDLSETSPRWSIRLIRSVSCVKPTWLSKRRRGKAFKTNRNL